MSEPSVAPEAQRRAGRFPIRAAALGLLALAAIIALVSLFGKDDDGAGAPAEATDPLATVSSATGETPSATSGNESTQSTAPAPAPSDAPSSTDATVAAEPTPEGVTVLITSQSWNAANQSIEVVGTVQGIAIESSTCTASATLDGAAVTASVEGVFDGSGTSCGLIAIPMAGHPPGSYQVVIEFASASGSGTSEPVVVTVP